MTGSTLDNAILEARRFLIRAQRLRSYIKHQPSEQILRVGSQETAAVRRASLDLSRALADLRRPQTTRSIRRSA